MTLFVVDASVAAKWFVPEKDSEEARSLLDSEHTLIAPDFLWIEIAQVAWKMARRGDIEHAGARAIVREMRGFPVEPYETGPLLADAVRLALERDRTVYDCLYLALAIDQGGVLVTADERFVNALTSGGLGDHVRRLRRE